MDTSQSLEKVQLFSADFMECIDKNTVRVLHDDGSFSEFDISDPEHIHMSKHRIQKDEKNSFIERRI
jgi:hypothetical protein